MFKLYPILFVKLDILCQLSGTIDWRMSEQIRKLVMANLFEVYYFYTIEVLDSDSESVLIDGDKN